MSAYTLSITGGPTEGTFGLRARLGGQTQEAVIPLNATPAQVRDALKSLPNIRDRWSGVAAVSGAQLPGGVQTIRTDGDAQGDVVLSLGTNNLTGGTGPAPGLSEDLNVRFDKPGRNDAGDVNTSGAFGPSN